MSEAHPIGSPVALRDAKLAQQLERGEEIGIILQRRRHDARVLYLSDRKAHWIDDARLWPVPAPNPALQRLSEALTVLEPEESNVERYEGAALELQLLCTDFDQQKLATLQARLGEALLRWSVQPYGMAFFTISLELRAD